MCQSKNNLSSLLSDHVIQTGWYDWSECIRLTSLNETCMCVQLQSSKWKARFHYPDEGKVPDTRSFSKGQSLRWPSWPESTLLNNVWLLQVNWDILQSMPEAWLQVTLLNTVLWTVVVAIHRHFDDTKIFCYNALVTKSVVPHAAICGHFDSFCDTMRCGGKLYGVRRILAVL